GLGSRSRPAASAAPTPASAPVVGERGACFATFTRRHVDRLLLAPHVDQIRIGTEDLEPRQRLVEGGTVDEAALYAGRQRRLGQPRDERRDLAVAIDVAAGKRQHANLHTL